MPHVGEEGKAKGKLNIDIIIINKAKDKSWPSAADHGHEGLRCLGGI